MRKVLLPLALCVLTLSVSQTHAEDEASLLAEFKTFAASEAPRLKEEFAVALATNPRCSRGFTDEQDRGAHRKLLIGGFGGMSERYTIDLKGTDDPVTPYVGTIEIEGRFFEGWVELSGCKTDAENPTLANCLASGARIEPDGTRVIFRIFPYRISYARRDGKWVATPTDPTPASTLVGGARREEEIPVEWSQYAAGASDNPPGPFPE